MHFTKLAWMPLCDSFTPATTNAEYLPLPDGPPANNICGSRTRKRSREENRRHLSSINGNQPESEIVDGLFVNKKIQNFRTPEMTQPICFITYIGFVTES